MTSFIPLEELSDLIIKHNLSNYVLAVDSPPASVDVVFIGKFTLIFCEKTHFNIYNKITTPPTFAMRPV